MNYAAFVPSRQAQAHGRKVAIKNNRRRALTIARATSKLCAAPRSGSALSRIENRADCALRCAQLHELGED
jgi:hypothetical protein